MITRHFVMNNRYVIFGINRFTTGNGNDFGSGDKYNEVEFKAEHPKEPTMNVIYKVYDLQHVKIQTVVSV